MTNLLTRDEIVALIEEIKRLNRTSDETGEIERKIVSLIDTLEAGALDPEIFDDMHKEIPELTPEEIADRALAYKPISCRTRASPEVPSPAEIFSAPRLNPAARPTD